MFLQIYVPFALAIPNMLQIARSLMRLVLIVMVFEFLSAPLIVDSWHSPENDVCYDVQHNDLQLPIFLKEQEEKETDKSTSVSTFTSLRDISNYNSVLRASRISELEIITIRAHTPRFMLFRSMQI